MGEEQGTVFSVTGYWVNFLILPELDTE